MRMGADERDAENGFVRADLEAARYDSSECHVPHPLRTHLVPATGFWAAETPAAPPPAAPQQDYRQRGYQESPGYSSGGGYGGGKYQGGRRPKKKEHWLSELFD